MADSWHKENKERWSEYKKANRRLNLYGDRSLMMKYREKYFGKQSGDVNVYGDCDKISLYNKAYYLKKRYGDESLMRLYKERYSREP